MAEGIPLRAGVDVERGIALYPNEVYGPVILKAYVLESRVAQYPRAVVGPGLISYLTHLKTLAPTNRWAAIASAKANDCEVLLCKAPDDGHPMLHMLSPEILSIGSEWTTAATAYEWAKAELHRFQKANDSKLIGYYARLLQYFNAHGFHG